MKQKFDKRDELRDIIKDSGIIDRPARAPDLDFKDLMRERINNILLVSSRYDFYTLVDDGQLTEAIFSEYLDLNLHYAPHITRVYSGEAALEALREQPYDLVMTMSRVGDMDLKSLYSAIKSIDPDLPVVLLAYQSRELQVLLESGEAKMYDRVFIWSGDRRLFLAIIKLFEDLTNSTVDCLEFGVRSIILVEDSPQFYSSFLPLIFTELIQQAQMLIEEGKSFAEKLLRQRARPKILLATTFEEAWDYYQTYRKTLLGIITDMSFKIAGVETENIGLRLIRQIRATDLELPILVQTAHTELQSEVESLGVSFADKNSRTLLLEVREFMKNNFGFGEFIFRLPDGREVGRATTIRELRNRLYEIPDESLMFHASRDHFSNWLMARTRFRLAARLKPVKITHFKTITDLRRYIIYMIEQLVIQDQRGIISDFLREEFDSEANFLRIGGGSLGGKARGLAFMDSILKNYLDADYFPNVKIAIPRSIILCTDVFNEFMESNQLLPKVLENISDEEILQLFLQAEFPEEVMQDLRTIVENTRFPLAVRSSSLLEDAIYQPFAGIYSTLMIPNSSQDTEIRFQQLVQAIKFVYASTYFDTAKRYIEYTGLRIEEEQMAVIIQQMAGRKFEHYFYPHFSGVARSYNYYPFGKTKQTDGVANLALGLGKTIVEGHVSLQYCPAYPTILPQFSCMKDYFANSQRKFYALDLSRADILEPPTEDENLVVLDIKDSERHGTLQYLASTYSTENDILYEGIFRTGQRIMTFAPILHSEVIPISKIIRLLMKLCETAMNCPVEIEFACSLGKDSALPADFSFLQLRPMVKLEGKIDLKLDELQPDEILLKSENVLGNGIYLVHDVVYIKPEVFQPAKTRETAGEIDVINSKLVNEKRPYLLIGPGRWGSRDPWLGIPIRFASISGAQAIVEASLPNMLPDPSQGSHFFQNLTSFRMVYFTIRHYKNEHAIDWDWLNRQSAESETQFVRHVRFDHNIELRVDGESGIGVIIKKATHTKESYFSVRK